MATRLLAFHSVNEVYGSGNQCTVEGKEDLATKKFLVLAQNFIDRDGRYSMVDDDVFAGLTFPDITGVSVKGKAAAGKKPAFTPYTAKQIWDRGMDCRRYLAQFIAGNAKKHLKFKVLKPAVAAEEGAPTTTDFGAVLEIPSGTDWKAVYGPLRLAVFTSSLKEKKEVVVVDVKQTENNQASVAVDTAEELEETKEIGPHQI